MDSSTAAVSALSLASKPTSCIGRIAWPGGPAKRQNFSIPRNIIYYMARNQHIPARNPSSPKLYSKLAASCKYFFEQLPLLVVNCVDYGNKKLCSNKTSEECDQKDRKCCVEIALIENTTSNNIWLTEELYISKWNYYYIESIIPKLYEAKDAKIRLDCCKPEMKQFKSWAAPFQNVKLIMWGGVLADDSNASIVTLDSIFEVFKNVKEMQYWFDLNTESSEAITPSSMKNMLEFKNLGNLEVLHLMNVPDVLNVEDLSAVMMAYKDIKFNLTFHRHISDEYELQLDFLIDDIIASELPDRLICYSGQNGEKLRIMKDRYRD